MKPRIDDMTPELRTRFEMFSARMAEAGVPFALTAVLRTTDEQAAYYAQGREPLAVVNKLRARAAMLPLPEKENAYTVTQTLNSRHFPGLDGKARAFDIAVLRGDKRLTWDTKFDGDLDSIPDYEEAARLGEEVGLEAGARWTSFKDWPHFQLPAGVR
jgi:peptidoglycan L-alanyl-D-glutamate endopeptidase CwlK